MKKSPVFPQTAIPRYGVIAGGLLDGWNFTFVRLLIVRKQPVLEVLAQHPHWPFPASAPVRLTRRDGAHLRNPGEVAPYLNSQFLIKAATEPSPQ